MTDGPWNILTVTEGGTVSLLKNLTEDQARGAMQNLRLPWDQSGDPWSDWAIQRRIQREKDGAEGRGGASSWSYGPRPGDLKQITCWGPPGETLVIWPKPADYEARYEAALAAYEPPAKARA